MIVDLDDFAADNHRLDLLYELKRINPAFRCTLFAIPARCPAEFLRLVPDWCQLAVHGLAHTELECKEWPYELMEQLIRSMQLPLAAYRWAHGFKAPYWAISDGCYGALQAYGWWVADQHLEDGRRPRGLRTYFYEDSPSFWHGHIQDVCGNGLAERFDELAEQVAHADRFQFASEAARPW